MLNMSRIQVPVAAFVIRISTRTQSSGTKVKWTDVGEQKSQKARMGHRFRESCLY